MGSLPDLDPDAAGYCAFYNVREQAGLPGASVTWSDVVGNSNVSGYQTYDNGVILQYSGGLTVRCKTDGWIVVHDEWDGSFGSRHAASIVSVSDTGFGSLSNNSLIQCLEDITSDLSDWNLANYSRADVGFFDFVWGADGISAFGLHDSDSGDSTFSYDRTIQETASTTTHALHGRGEASMDNAGGTIDIIVDGGTVVDVNGKTPDDGRTDQTTSMDQNGTSTVTFDVTSDYALVKRWSWVSVGLWSDS